MADINPLGSEKLQGDDKLKRILELTYYGQSNINESTNKADFISESENGVYGIVREKDGYYVKHGINESSLDYIGGLFMKNKNRFKSYSEALKRLELIKGQESLQEATKYVLKKSTGESESPMPEAPATEEPMPSEPVPSEMPAEEPMPTDGMPSEEMPSDMGGEESSEEEAAKPSDYMSEIQKFAGKLGQALRDEKERLESDDMKYVINMILSAVNLEKLEEEDREEILKRFESDEEESFDEPGDGEDYNDMADETGDDGFPSENPEEGDLEEVDYGMDALESFVNSPAYQEEEIDLSNYADLGEEDDVQELDIDEMKNEISKSIGETLSKYFK